MRRQGGTRGPAGPSAGATLIELLAVVVISSFVVLAILSAIFVGFSTTGATTQRLANSHGTEMVDTYFSRDVASAAPAGITTATAPTGCSGASPGTNLVVLPYAAGPGDDQQRSAYRFDVRDATVSRFHCVTGGAPLQMIVARGVASASATLAVDAGGQTTVTLTVNLITPVGERFQVSGHSRTPTPPPTLPEEVTPTSAPPLPCKVESAAATPNPVGIASGTMLTADVAISISVSGDCRAPLSVSLTPGASGPPVTVALAASGSGFGATLAKSGYAWTAGSKTVTVGQTGDGSVTSPSFSFTVMSQCTVSAAAASPNPATIASGTTLAADVNVLVSVTGLCTPPLSLSFVPGSSGAAVTAPLTASGSAYTATLGRSAYGWTTGTKSIAVQQTGGSVLGAPLPLVVNAPTPCTVTAATATPNPVDRDSAGRLKASVAVTVTTTGTCTGLQIQYSPQSSAVTQSLTQSGATWSATIPSGGSNPKWNAGSHPIAVLGATNSWTLTLAVNA